MRIATWNVNGIRARHAELVTWAKAGDFDVICLQELKASTEQIPELLLTLPEYRSFWHGKVGGYSGVSLHLRRSTFADRVLFTHPPFDSEARIVQASVGDLVLVSVYVPNGGKDYPAKIAFLEAMAAYVPAVHEQGKLLVLCGDLNVARTDQDVHPSQRKPYLVGQRPEERALFERLIGAGLVDVGRMLHPKDKGLFTWWPYWRNARERNLGWRLDYVLASRPLADTAASALVAKDVGTSDHAPVVVDLGSGAA